MVAGYGYVWPESGWAVAPGPILDHDSPRPLEPGDGLCAARSWAGLATVEIPPVDLILVAFGDDDLLSVDSDPHSVRLRRAYVVERVNGIELLQRHGRFADLENAGLDNLDLANICLIGANLRSARLRSANLAGASLYGADLTGAQLAGADLTGADLRYASLRGANLHGAKLHGAMMYGCDINGTNSQVGTLANARYTLD